MSKGLVAFMVTMAFVLTACATPQNQPEAESPQSNVSAYQKEVTKEPSKELTATETIREYKRLESNYKEDADIGVFYIMGEKFHLGDSIDDFTKKTGLSECSWATYSLNTDEIKFWAKGYGIKSDPKDETSFYGTTVYVSVDDNGIINGFATSSFFVADDFEPEFYNELKIKSEISELKTIFGDYDKNIVHSTRLVFKNSKATMIISTAGTVDEVILMTSE